MKKIEVIIRPMRLEAVKSALADEGHVTGLTVTDVRGFGQQPESFGMLLRGQEEGNHLAPKVKIEMVVLDSQVDSIVELLQLYARTGQPGDGKIFVSRIEDALRIRTGDRGDDAV